MSQAQEATETIGEHEYTMYMLPPIQSHNLLMDIVKMVGPALGDVIGGVLSGRSADKKVDLMEQEVGPEVITKAAGKLFQDVNKQTLEKVISSFRGVTHVDGKPLDKIFDVIFRGGLDEMYKWLFFGMRVQWGKSLSALVSGIGGQGGLASLGSQLESPTTSTG